MNEIKEKLDQQSDIGDEQKSINDELQKRLSDIDDKVQQHEELIKKCVSWDQLDNSFRKDILKDDASVEDLCSEQRKDYPNYFKFGIKTLFKWRD